MTESIFSSHRSDLAFALLLICSIPAFACDRNQSGVFEDIECATDALSRARIEMKSSIQALSEKYTTEELVALTQAQNKWEEQTLAAGALLSEREGFGSAGRLMAANAAEQAVRNRTAELNRLLGSHAVRPKEDLLPRLLKGSYRGLPNDGSLVELLSARWPDHEQYRAKNGSTGDEIVVASCMDLESASARQQFASDTAGIGRESFQQEYCKNIKRLIHAKAAIHTEIDFPLCLDKVLYIELSNTVSKMWKPATLQSVELVECTQSTSRAVLKFADNIEPANEWHAGLSTGRVSLRYLVQGDFDGDGFLDVVAAASTELVFPQRVWYQSGTSAVVKISRVRGILTVTNFDDY